jgi:hypothetical protein
MKRDHKCPTNRMTVNQISDRLTVIHFIEWDFIVMIITCPFGYEVQSGTVDQFIEVFCKPQPQLDFQI